MLTEESYQTQYLDLNSIKELPESHTWTSLQDDCTDCLSNESESLPIIDLNDPDVLALVRHACETWGVLQVKNHGVSLRLLEDMEAATTKLFSLPIEQKLKVSLSSSNDISGYRLPKISPFFPKLMWREGFTIFGSPVEHAVKLWPQDYKPFCVLHRALVNRKQQRISVAYIYGPPANVLISPLPKLVDHYHLCLFRPITWTEYLELKSKHFTNTLSLIQISEIPLNPKRRTGKGVEIPACSCKPTYKVPSRQNIDVVEQPGFRIVEATVKEGFKDWIQGCWLGVTAEPCWEDSLQEFIISQGFSFIQVKQLSPRTCLLTLVDKEDMHFDMSN
uniref:Non-haem dioxygenase N-terminal domain-containing protein n=1 Tax=Daucus carota subsp. sativus TaxID=79200 RepID=A0A164UQR2_DAUCS